MKTAEERERERERFLRKRKLKEEEKMGSRKRGQKRVREYTGDNVKPRM